MIIHHDLDNDVTLRLEDVQDLIKLILTEYKRLFYTQIWIIYHLFKRLDLSQNRTISLNSPVIVEI